jgi:hypothetical protein
MSASWRAVAAWFAGAFRFRRGHHLVQPWNTISLRALTEDLHLPFEAYSLAPVAAAPLLSAPAFEPITESERPAAPSEDGAGSAAA